MKFLAALAVALAASYAWGECTIVRNATVETGAGAEQRTIAFADGAIIDPATARDCSVIDADGRFVTAGLIDAATNAGIVEVPSVDGTNDASLDGYALGAGFDPGYAMNPESEVIRVARVAGIVAGSLLPSAGPDPFAGLVRAYGYSEAIDELTSGPAGLLARFGSRGAALTGGSRAATIQHLIEAIREARHYDANRRQYERGSHPPYRFSRTDLEALARVANGELPLFVMADRAADIRVLLGVTAELDIEFALFGGSDAWKVADELAARDVMVVVNPLTNHAQFEYLGARLDNAALLHAAGVEVAISPFSGHDSRKIRQLAGLAVANGMPRTAAIAAMTSTPAQLLGIDDVTGDLEVGSRADLVIWNGDPLELLTYPEYVFVAGEAMDLKSRQIRLAERYLNLDDPTPLHLR